MEAMEQQAASMDQAVPTTVVTQVATEILPMEAVPIEMALIMEISVDLADLVASVVFGGSRGGRRVNRGSDLRVKGEAEPERDRITAWKKRSGEEVCALFAIVTVAGGSSEGVKTCDTCKGSGVVTRIANTILGQMQTQTTCPTCGGEGKIVVKKCTECNGEGVVRDDEIITINIPAGVAEGMQLSMNGKGNAARHGGINGDLLILIEEEPHPELIRDENDLLYNLLLSVPQAALGATVEVPTIDGKAKLKIEPGTQPGKVLRLRNKGLPSINSYGTGDLLVNVSVYIPETLSSTEKETLNGLENSPNFQPNKTMKEKIFSKFKHFFD